MSSSAMTKDEISETVRRATAAFWTAFATHFPEDESCPTNLGGKDQAALLLWIFADEIGIRSCQVWQASIPDDWDNKLLRKNDAQIRIERAAESSIRAAAVVLFGDKDEVIPSDVYKELVDCARTHYLIRMGQNREPSPVLAQ